MMAAINVMLNISFLMGQANESISAKFQARLYEACVKIEKTTDLSSCKCYSSQVTKRYNDVQLSAIYKLLKIPEANKMFVVAHSPEGIACRNGLSK